MKRAEINQRRADGERLFATEDMVFRGEEYEKGSPLPDFTARSTVEAAMRFGAEWKSTVEAAPKPAAKKAAAKKSSAKSDD